MSAAATDRFVSYLVMKSEREGNTEFVSQLAKLAETQILAGKGSVGFLQAASGNGKSVTQASSLTCDEVGLACETALRIIADEGHSSPTTSPDFSNMFQQ